MTTGNYVAHRIVWKMVTGKEPPPNIDHKNGDGYDNSWANLRVADQTKQNWNRRIPKSNASGHKGVSRDHNSWKATISVNKKPRHLGCFSSADDAAAAYNAAARELHGEFYREARL
jgi:hypothetical protein